MMRTFRPFFFVLVSFLLFASNLWASSFDQLRDNISESLQRMLEERGDPRVSFFEKRHDYFSDFKKDNRGRIIFPFMGPLFEGLLDSQGDKWNQEEKWWQGERWDHRFGINEEVRMDFIDTNLFTAKQLEDIYELGIPSDQIDLCIQFLSDMGFFQYSKGADGLDMTNWVKCIEAYVLTYLIYFSNNEDLRSIIPNLYQNLVIEATKRNQKSNVEYYRQSGQTAPVWLFKKDLKNLLDIELDKK